MKAWIVTELGEPDQRVWAEVEKPKPRPDQVAIQVAASSLNFLDSLMIAGRCQVRPPLPFIPGVEVSGTIIAAGEHSAFSIGEPVCATLQAGDFARVAVADRSETARIPAEMSFVEGVSEVLPILEAPAAIKMMAARQTHGKVVLVH